MATKISKVFDLAALKQIFAEAGAGGKRRVIVYFGGNLDSSNQSWCPDCRTASPYVSEAVDEFTTEHDVFVSCEVGERAVWKDSQNVFRQHPSLRLERVPTLMLFTPPFEAGGDLPRPARVLVEGDCANIKPLKKFFE